MPGLISYLMGLSRIIVIIVVTLFFASIAGNILFRLKRGPVQSSKSSKSIQSIQSIQSSKSSTSSTSSASLQSDQSDQSESATRETESTDINKAD
jgi:hypothetical protein